MIREVRGACAEAGMQVPETPWETARVIYRSLASCYGRTAEEIERLTGRSFDAVHIVARLAQLLLQVLQLPGHNVHAEVEHQVDNLT